MTEQILNLILGDDLPLDAGDRVVVLVNSLGATTMMECLIVLRKAAQILEAHGIVLHDAMVGDWVTCQEMAGISLSVTKLDDELTPLWELPCQSVSLTRQ